MIKIENNHVQIEGDMIEIVDNIAGLMEALNTSLPIENERHEFFWSGLFACKDKNGQASVVKFLDNLSKGYDIYTEVTKNDGD